MPDAAHQPRTYRPDIDTLRAIAVSSVLLYHAKVPGFGGGYVGVDVFFVISGFLITGILRADPSIKHFYIRRAARILPALFAMLLFCIVAGSFLLLPSDMEELSVSMLATLGFSSNILFWQQAGYFESVSEIKPLLHTWSLAVEEQFYIFFPLLLIFAKNWKNRSVAIVLLVVGIVSFLLANYVMRIGKPSMAFFLAPPRAWELLIGSLIALGMVPTMRSEWVRTAVAATGLLMIVATVAIYTDATRFPGTSALLPVLGTALVIAAGSQGEHKLSPALALKPVLFIGLISYSLYLWHWPLLAYLRYYEIGDSSLAQALIALVVALVMATLSWRYVERPFRGRNLGKRQWGYAVGPVVFVTACVLVLAYGGLPSRFRPEVVAMNEANGDVARCPYWSARPFGGAIACPLGQGNSDPSDAQLVLWGDSHAEMYGNPFAQANGSRKAVLILARSCAPVTGFNSSQSCASTQSANLEQIATLSAPTVVLALNWSQYSTIMMHDAAGHAKPANRLRTVAESMDATVDRLVAAGKKVVVIGPIATPGYYISSVASRELQFHGSIRHPTGIAQREFEAKFAPVLEELKRLESSGRAHVVYAHQWICKQGWCPYVDPTNHAMFADRGHLAAAYARTLTPMFAPVLQQVEAEGEAKLLPATASLERGTGATLATPAVLSQ